MPITVHVPTPLRKLTNNKAEVEVQAESVGELVENLDAAYGGIKDKLVDEAGEIRRYVNIYVNEEDIRFLNGADTELRDGDSLTIVPAIAGGCVLG
jgi:molybdopterin synthase sulfur carrier subunit